MASKKHFQNVQQVLAPKIYPMGWVLKFDPPVIGLLYRRSLKETKKHLFQIHLNNLIFLTNAEDITRQIFFEHPHFLNPQIIKPDQVLNLVMKLLEYKNQRLREMAQFMEEYGDQDENEIIDNEVQMDDESEYANLNEEQLFELYQQQMHQVKDQQNFNKVRDVNKSF